jgi:hypothetical protein
LIEFLVEVSFEIVAIPDMKPAPSYEWSLGAKASLISGSRRKVSMAVFFLFDFFPVTAEAFCCIRSAECSSFPDSKHHDTPGTGTDGRNSVCREVIVSLAGVPRPCPRALT